MGRGASAALAAASLLLAACGSSGPPRTPGSRVSTTLAAPSTTTSTTTRPPTPAEADARTQFILAEAANAAKTIYGQHADYSAVSPGNLALLDPKVHFAALEQASRTIVGVLAQDRNDVLFATESASGHWFCITENAMDGVSYGEGRALADVDSNGECQAPNWLPPGS